MIKRFSLKRIVAAVLLTAVAASFFGCNGKSSKNDDVSINTSAPSKKPMQTPGTTPENDNQINDETIWEDDWENNDEDGGVSVPDKEDVIVGTVTKSDFGESVVYANSIANKIQAKYVDGKRNSYEVSNNDSVLTEKLFSARSCTTRSVTIPTARLIMTSTTTSFARRWASRLPLTTSAASRWLWLRARISSSLWLTV